LLGSPSHALERRSPGLENQARGLTAGRLELARGRCLEVAGAGVAERRTPAGQLGGPRCADPVGSGPRFRPNRRRLNLGLLLQAP
jgi:hypothetical protein